MYIFSVIGLGSIALFLDYKILTFIICVFRGGGKLRVINIVKQIQKKTEKLFLKKSTA